LEFCPTCKTLLKKSNNKLVCPKCEYVKKIDKPIKEKPAELDSDLFIEEIEDGFFIVRVDEIVNEQLKTFEEAYNDLIKDVKEERLFYFRVRLLLLQYRRRLVSDLLLQVPKSGTLLTGPITGLKEKYSDLLDHLNNEISKTVKLVTDDVVNNPEETEQDVASEIYFDEDLKVKE